MVNAILLCCWSVQSIEFNGSLIIECRFYESPLITADNDGDIFVGRVSASQIIICEFQFESDAPIGRSPRRIGTSDSEVGGCFTVMVEGWRRARERTMYQRLRASVNPALVKMNN
jgi:hypothetical protein